MVGNDAVGAWDFLGKISCTKKYALLTLHKGHIAMRTMKKVFLSAKLATHSAALYALLTIKTALGTVRDLTYFKYQLCLDDRKDKENDPCFCGDLPDCSAWKRRVEVMDEKIKKEDKTIEYMAKDINSINKEIADVEKDITLTKHKISILENEKCTWP